MVDKPQKPKEEDCCGSGCNPCIFDVYEQQLKLWERRELETQDSILDRLKYSPFKLTSKEAVTNHVNCYTFQALNKNFEPVCSRIPMKMGDYLILKASYKQGNISRPYTPIINNQLLFGCFQVLIKLYPTGEMSSVLRETKVGEVMYWRGPYNHFPYIKSNYLVLIGAGTGIVPLHNIASELVFDENCETIIKFIGCFASMEDVLLRNELHELSSFWNFSMQYFISHQSDRTLLIRENVVYSKLTAEKLNEILHWYKDKDVHFVICGPEAFNLHCKDCLIGFNRITVL